MRTFAMAIMTFLLVTPVLGQSYGNALLVDGDDDFMKAQGTVLTNLDSLTISAWIKSWTGGAILTNHRHGLSWESVELLGQWFIINYGDDQSTRQLLNYPVIADSSWHHIAAVWNGSNIWVYLDGMAYSDTVTAMNAPWISSAPMTIGARESFSAPLAISEYTGKIDELRIWNTARTQTQIQALMHRTLGSDYYGSLDSGLIAYWRFDELEDLGVGGDGPDDVRDYSVNQMHGDLVGDAVLDTSSVVLGINDDEQMPQSFTLYQNYPNPFNPITVISWQLPVRSEVDLKIFNLQGQKIKTLLFASLLPGFHSIEFDASGIASGIYFYRLEAGNFIETKKMVVLK